MPRVLSRVAWAKMKTVIGQNTGARIHCFPNEFFFVEKLTVESTLAMTNVFSYLHLYYQKFTDM